MTAGRKGRFYSVPRAGIGFTVPIDTINRVVPALIARGGSFVPGDAIVAIGDRPVTSVSRLQARLDDYRPGDRMPVMVLREDRRLEVEITLGAER